MKKIGPHFNLLKQISQSLNSFRFIFIQPIKILFWEEKAIKNQFITRIQNIKHRGYIYIHAINI